MCRHWFLAQQISCMCLSWGYSTWKQWPMYSRYCFWSLLNLSRVSLLNIWNFHCTNAILFQSLPSRSVEQILTVEHLKYATLDPASMHASFLSVEQMPFARPLCMTSHALADLDSLVMEGMAASNVSIWSSLWWHCSFFEACSARLKSFVWFVFFSCTDCGRTRNPRLRNKFWLSWLHCMPKHSVHQSLRCGCPLCPNCKLQSYFSSASLHLPRWIHRQPYNWVPSA